MGGIAGLVTGICSLWIKYDWLYPFTLDPSFRHAARVNASFQDPDQAATAVAGLMTLLFSLRAAVQERKTFRKRVEAIGLENLDMVRGTTIDGYESMESTSSRPVCYSFMINVQSKSP
jgi:hypothetical protein